MASLQPDLPVDFSTVLTVVSSTSVSVFFTKEKGGAGGAIFNLLFQLINALTGTTSAEARKALKK